MEVEGDVDGLAAVVEGADDPEAGGVAGDPEASLASRAFNAIALCVSFFLHRVRNRNGRRRERTGLTAYVLLLPLLHLDLGGRYIHQLLDLPTPGLALYVQPA